MKSEVWLGRTKAGTEIYWISETGIRKPNFKILTSAGSGLLSALGLRKLVEVEGISDKITNIWF